MVCDPCNVDYGGTAVGARTAIPGGSVRINNMNAARSFTVRELRIVDEGGDPMGGVFELIGFDGPVEVVAGGGLDVDVAFTPEQAITYQARVEVFIDADPDVVTFVTLSGEGIGAKARGGGCAAGGGAAGGGGCATALALACALLRRRRAAVAVQPAWSTRRWLGLALGVGLLAPPATARADVTRNIDLDVFRPAGGGDPELMAVETPGIGRPGTWSLALFLDWASKPLGVEPPTGEVRYPVRSRTGYELVFDYAMGERSELGLRLPMLKQSGDARMLNIDPAEGSALGDIALTAKWRALGGASAALAGRAELTLPTASDGEFAGVDWPTLHAQLVLGAAVGRVDLGANAGFRLRKQARFLDVTQDDELSYGLGAGVRVARRTSVIAELYGARGLGPDKNAGSSPLEAALGMRYRMARSVGVAVGLGRGMMPGVGAPELRGFLLVAYTPGARELPAIAIAPERIVDRADGDLDGIIAEYDRCPEQAEDLDEFEDEDGCIDADNDADGLTDGQDDCPNEAEDKDKFKDDDGCIDEDNDGDGIADTDDKCPDEVEDKDGFLDRDGCDDPDNDRDGVPDVIDQCAVEAETINGVDDEDGCPDRGDSSIIEQGDRIDLVEPVRFRGATAVLLPRSEKVLAQVGALLRARPEWTAVRIGVHVHPRGARDEALSRQRAEAVRAWLVGWGVDRDRLEIKAHGSSRPLVPANAGKAEQLNDRVEIVVEERRESK
jgi:outer membrane protein OmpA-like peptidoglycan-associated protein